jgi:glycosyltransferase involved in cell wall biosynthesis
MRLGVDITPLQSVSPGGIGTATYETLRALTQLPGIEIILYGTAPPVVPFSGAPLDIDLPLRVGTGLLARSNIAWIRYGVSPLLRRDAIDVFWGTRHVLPSDTDHAALVATLYDFWHIHHPGQQPLLNRAMNRCSIASTMRSGDVFSAISQATAADARQLFPRCANRIDVNALGVDAAAFSPLPASHVDAEVSRLGVSRPYILLLDVFNQRKNAGVVLQAVASLDEMADFQIVALGRPRATAGEVKVPSLAAQLGLSERLILPGDVSARSLHALYSSALALVYPSVYEGFGMPVLEAMAAGAPVITSDRSSLPEVAGDAAALVDPTSASAVAQALREVLGSEGRRAQMRAAGLARAATFTWRRTAEGMLRSFERAIRLRAEGGTS